MSIPAKYHVRIQAIIDRQVPGNALCGSDIFWNKAAAAEALTNVQKMIDDMNEVRADAAGEYDAVEEGLGELDSTSGPQPASLNDLKITMRFAGFWIARYQGWRSRLTAAVARDVSFPVVL